jgi:hypothetical protein
MQLLTGLGTAPEKVEFSPDGRSLAASGDWVLQLWDLDD